MGGPLKEETTDCARRRVNGTAGNSCPFTLSPSVARERDRERERERERERLRERENQKN